MARDNATTRLGRLWNPHLRGHFLRFDGPDSFAKLSPTSVRLPVVAAVLEILRVSVIHWVGPDVPLFLLTLPLLGIALLAVPTLTDVPLIQLGLRPWHAWSSIEKSYFLQVMLGAALLVLFLLAASADPLRQIAGGFVPYLFFGFYQELVYRGLIQRQLVRGWGAPIGIFAANLLYTFGPLHASYFAVAASLAIPMFASIFLIGLFFGVLYWRSGNLWIVGCFHAIGNAVIVWQLGHSV
jgi:membrane protease YdiL (CAAX protease family)